MDRLKKLLEVAGGWSLWVVYDSKKIDRDEADSMIQKAAGKKANGFGTAVQNMERDMSFDFKSESDAMKAGKAIMKLADKIPKLHAEVNEPEEF